MEFDGNSDYVDLGDPAALTLNRDFTVAAWVKFDNVSGEGWEAIVSHGEHDWSLIKNTTTHELQVAEDNIVNYFRLCPQTLLADVFVKRYMVLQFLSTDTIPFGI